MRILVLGAGVVGTTTAWLLTRAGHEVQVLEREGEVARGTSHANGALIHTSLVAPWNTPGIGRELAGALLSRASPVTLRAAALPGMLGWGLRFLRNSRPDRHRRHTLSNLRLARLSAATLNEVRREAGISYHQGRRGLLEVVRAQADLDRALAGARLLEREGAVPFRALDPKQVLALEPALGDVGHELAGGLHFPADESGDCRLFTRGLAADAIRLGAHFRLHTPVERIESEGDRITGVIAGYEQLRADRYVLATGCWSTRLARQIGLKLPINPVAGHALTLLAGGWHDPPRTPVVDESLHVAVTPLGERLRIVGAADFAGPEAKLPAARSDLVWASALRIYPALRRYADLAALERWTGFRPMTPDGVPILGPCRFKNLLLNTGHGHLGWTLACGSARLIAALVDGEAPPIDLAGLTVERFSGR